MKNNFINELPKKRTGNYLQWIANSSVKKIVIIGFSMYILPVLFFSLVELVFMSNGVSLIIDQKGNSANLYDLLYFNFISILTIGYGDFSPVGIGRFFSIIESIIGVSVIGLLISFITAKLLASPQRSIVFSKYGYYCTEEEKFLIIFVNTTNSLFLNAEMSFYFKLGGDWIVHPSIRSPFITSSVQTFFLNKVLIENMISKLKKGDVMRFAIEGQLGYSTHSAAIEYDIENIFIIPNRAELISYQGFKDVDFSSEEFINMFHYYPKEPINLKSYIQSYREKYEKV